MGTIPVDGADSGDSIEESILALSFSNKGSRYICSGGSGQVVRIWDLQRKRCIKRLKGHTNTITGAIYNCKDEHLASISLSGDLILHSLASGARAAEFKDPNEQVLRVLDYSRFSRHLLVTAGDDGTVHMWDTTNRSPKMSWLKQHSAPTTGISFSPSNDKVIASVGLDKKLYTYDLGSRRPSSIVSYESPFSTMAFKEDGFTLSAGTTNGRVVLYDVRGKPQPYTVLRAYSSSEAVTSLCWQRSKPVMVNEGTCSSETVLLGGAVEDSVLMPDPEPSVASSSLPQSTAVSGSRNIGHSVSLEPSLSAEETPNRGHQWPGKLTRLHAPRSSYTFKDDMEVFSPLMDVKPVTPSLNKLWDDRDGAKIDSVDKKPMSPLFPHIGRSSFAGDGAIDHTIFDWKANSVNRQNDTQSSFAMLGSTPPPSSKTENDSTTPPEAWGGESLSDKFSRLHQPLNVPSHSSTNQIGAGSLTNSNLGYGSFRNKDVSSNTETPLGFLEHVPFSSLSLSLGTEGITGQANLEVAGPTSLTMPRRFSTYAERISTISSFSDGTSLSVASPKTKKTGVDTKEELLSSLLSRSGTSSTTDPGALPALNGASVQPQNLPRADMRQGASFTLQLFQRTLEGTLDSFQKSIHEDVRNLHIEMLRQFHMQEVEMSSAMNSILENQAELMKEVESLRRENQQLRQLL